MDRRPQTETAETGSDCPEWAEELTACTTGWRLLQQFRQSRPNDYEFLQARDFIDLRTSAFDGIPEWDAFVQHYESCESCRGNVAEL